jgi:hypothetical protein
MRLGSAVMGIFFLIVALISGPSELRHYTVMGAGPFLGLWLGLTLTRRESAAGMPAEMVWVIGAGAVLFGTVYWCGMRQFGGFDDALPVDIGWRLLQGQTPYVDFPCTLPVGFYLGAEYAMRLFGVRWSSLILFNAFYTLATFAWLYALLRATLLDRRLCWWVAVSCELVSTVVVAHWWYNPITSIAAVVYVASVLAVLLKPGSVWRWVSVCLSLYLVALMKPNLAGVVIIGGSLSLILSAGTRWKAILASLLAFGLWMLTIGIHHSTIGQVLTGYISVASYVASLARFLSGMRPPEKVFAVAIIVAACVPWREAVACRKFGRDWVVLPVLVFCMLSGFVGLTSNGEMVMVELPMMLLSGIFIVAGPREDSAGGFALPPRWTAYFTIFCAVLTCSAYTQALVRHRVWGIGALFEWKIDPEPFTLPFFKGLHAGHDLHVIVDEIARLFATQDMSHAYFGIRLQWAYAAFNLPSPKDHPIWWQPGASFNPKEESHYLEIWEQQKFDPVVLMDTTFLGDPFIGYLEQNYGLETTVPVEEKYTAPVEVLKLKKPGEPPLPAWHPWISPVPLRWWQNLFHASDAPARSPEGSRSAV